MITDEERVDEAGKESFPASDSPSWTSGILPSHEEATAPRAMKVAALGEADVKARLEKLTGWTLRGGKLHREYLFGDFVEAFAFMTRCARMAERQGHHPEWFNVFNRVVVDLTTHDAGGISALDFALAIEMDGAALRTAEADPPAP
jgi:4a-hydroxytetrahydrobiopterin dehydratase